MVLVRSARERPFLRLWWWARAPSLLLLLLLMLLLLFLLLLLLLSLKLTQGWCSFIVLLLQRYVFLLHLWPLLLLFLLPLFHHAQSNWP